MLGRRKHAPGRRGGQREVLARCATGVVARKCCFASPRGDWTGEQWLGGKRPREQASQTRPPSLGAGTRAAHRAAIPAEAHLSQAWKGTMRQPQGWTRPTGRGEEGQSLVHLRTAVHHQGLSGHKVTV